MTLCHVVVTLQVELERCLGGARGRDAQLAWQVSNGARSFMARSLLLQNDADDCKDDECKEDDIKASALEETWALTARLARALGRSCVMAFISLLLWNNQLEL